MHDAAFMYCTKAIWQYSRNIPSLIIMDKVSQNVNEKLCIKLQSSYYGQCVNIRVPQPATLLKHFIFQ